MKNCSRFLSALLLLAIVCSMFSVGASAAPASSKITTTATGYDSADDVEYVTNSVSGRNVIANWGARGEVCVFLSKYVDNYYTEDYETLINYSGGTSTSNTPSSALYGELQDLMTESHDFYTYYDGNKNVRNFYRYTDCVSNDTSKVSILYRGDMVTSTWNQGNIWNQEHVWPQSKLSNSKEVGDIMHLRPSNPSENSSRGNTPYGEGSGYYNPGPSVRGDCARTVLYMYVRWGITGKMWGSSGVIESLDILLKWMKEDPVDTWEMGRNDSVQSVTGVRNVFIDYPELAWLLFGKEVPSDMTTPSGNAKNGNTGSGGSGNTGSGDTSCKHTSTELRGKEEPTCTEKGYTGDTHCTSCGKKLASGSKIAAKGHTDANNDETCDVCRASLGCDHRMVDTRGAEPATCTQDGYTGDTYCLDCGKKLSDGSPISATGHVDANSDNICDNCNTAINPATEETVPPTGESTTATEESVPPTTVPGTVDTVPATGPATVPSENIPPMNTDSDAKDNSIAIWIIVGVVVLLVIGIIIVKKKKENVE